MKPPLFTVEDLEQTLDRAYLADSVTLPGVQVRELLTIADRVHSADLAKLDHLRKVPINGDVIVVNKDMVLLLTLALKAKRPWKSPFAR